MGGGSRGAFSVKTPVMVVSGIVMHPTRVGSVLLSSRDWPNGQKGKEDVIL